MYLWRSVIQMLFAPAARYVNIKLKYYEVSSEVGGISNVLLNNNIILCAYSINQPTNVISKSSARH